MCQQVTVRHRGLTTTLTEKLYIEKAQGQETRTRKNTCEKTRSPSTDCWRLPETAIKKTSRGKSQKFPKVLLQHRFMTVFAVTKLGNTFPNLFIISGYPDTFSAFILKRKIQIWSEWCSLILNYYLKRCIGWELQLKLIRVSMYQFRVTV